MKSAASQNLNNFVVPQFSKLFVSQFQLINVLSYFFLFFCGLTTGVIFTSYYKSTSINFHLTQYALATRTSASTTTTTTTTIAPPPPPPVEGPPTVPELTKNETVKAAAVKKERVGLKEYLKVPDIRHDMEEEELLWRASVAPRRQQYPFERVPKVAFMFLTKGPVLMAPLWEKFFKGHEGLYSIYVHSNPSYNDTEPESPVFHGRRIPSKDVSWGDANMIEAERRLLANALLDIANQRFVLLSETCIPLFNFPTVYNYLMNSTQSFVESYDLDGPVGRGRYNHKMRPEIEFEQWRKGAQWFEMNRELAIEVVSDQKYFPVFQKHCKDGCYSDEHYLPTFVGMKHGAQNANRTLTWVDWSRGGPHPAQFMRQHVTMEFLEYMRSGKECTYNGNTTRICSLFARKFTPHALDRLLRFSPKAMHF